MIEQRPNPDDVLAWVESQERKAARGRLKVFFGASPGVGKTYSMLEEAGEVQREGREVVVGIVETHGRAETATLLEGLETLPRKPIEYKGRTFLEFDLDAALERSPDLLLVDELAHSNIPGSRHEKRWQDVEELLDAGINVATTLNVQHVESLCDVVHGITGVSMQETVPDRILDEADEIALVDLPPDDLLQRLAEGKVYVPEAIERARNNFFRKGNLLALREMALRKTADRVDTQVQEYRREKGIHDPWATTERILVCVGTSPFSTSLIRSARRMASASRAKWYALSIETPGTLTRPESEQRRLVENLKLAESLGAETVVLHGDRISDEVLTFARDRSVTRIILGKPQRRRFAEQLRTSFLDEIIRGSGPIEVTIISGTEEDRIAPSGVPTQFRVRWGQFALALTVVGGVTLLGRWFEPFFAPADITMTYLLGVLLCAIFFGRGPSIAASVASMVAFNFFFTEPRHTFRVADQRYIITFAVMLVAALTTSSLVARLRKQSISAQNRERHIRQSFELSKSLLSIKTTLSLVREVTRIAREVFKCEAGIIIKDAFGEGARPHPDAPLPNGFELPVAIWSFQHAQPAGWSTATLQGAKGYYLPLKTADGCVGAVGLLPREPGLLLTPSERDLLDTILAQTALAMSRILNAERTHIANLEIESERLRSAMLGSFSHDMRTPLASILGAAETLLAGGDRISESDSRAMLEAIRWQAQAMSRLVEDLLQYTRLRSAGMVLKPELTPMEDVLSSAIQRLDQRLKDYRLAVINADPSALMFGDEVLLEQVLVNLLENAMDFSEPGSEIIVKAMAEPGHVYFSVADQGIGFTPGEEQQVFQQLFTRRGSTDRPGTGLGLSISEAIVRLHGGTITASNRKDGGAEVRFTLPQLESINTLDDDLE